MYEEFMSIVWYLVGLAVVVTVYSLIWSWFDVGRL